MKAVVFTCLKELVENKFGEDKWAQIAQEVGLDPGARFLPVADVDDAIVLKAIGATCSVLGITQQQAADAFGEYWVCEYAPKLYGSYYLGVKTAKEFLLRLDGIHVATTRAIPNAHPPRFTYEEVNDNTLIMRYQSKRGLMPIFMGLVRGVAKYFGETADVSMVGADRVKIVFRRA